MLTTEQQFRLIAQLGLIEGIKAGAFQDSAAGSAAVAALTNVTSPNATDLPTALTLVNEIKTKLNAVIAALKTA
ncbi:head fiber protein [Pseudomonas phage VCM]|uniref:Uncharacterized protein n=1 Tax=Pseudomonas phage VCM TaxID=1729937 RepID=A0A0S4KZ27_9CAUD|nr:head fiber protein [Pseudomonas phage VCM]CUR44334.1 hypothetical protein VCM_00115 [Pseudomonas phage VCM]